MTVSPVGPGPGAEWRLLDRSHRTAQDGVGPARDWRCRCRLFPSRWWRFRVPAAVPLWDP